MKMSPLTAELKCPHYEKGHYSNESEREAEVPFPKNGDSWQAYLESSKQRSGHFLPSCKTTEEGTPQ